MKNSNDNGDESQPGLSDGTTSWSRRSRRSTIANVARRPRYISFLYLVALWTLPGLLYSVQIYQLGLRENTPSATFLHSMFHALPVWWFWIPLTPLLVRLARRYPIRSTGAFKEIAIHLAFSVIVAVLVATLAGFWFSTTAPFATRDRPWSSWTMDLMLSTTLHLYFWCYWLIIAAVHFLDHERRLREQEVNTARLDALAAQSRMQMLANQLQPHFLFNALNGLSTQILRGDTKSAQSMLESLAAFLRASLRMGEAKFVRFRDELDLISKYLSVENVRWGDRLNVQTTVQPDAEHALIPTLLLQPLVENAIRHGVATSETGGEIVIRAEKLDDRLLLQIENDGTGLSPDWQDRAENQVGLANTRRRLDLLFEERYDLHLEELSNGRVRLELTLPFQTQNGEPGSASAGSVNGSEPAR
jgi:two-component system LytT family sensor kinase